MSRVSFHRSSPVSMISCLAMVGAFARVGSAQVVFQDDFDAGNMNNWTPTATSPLYADNSKNREPSGGTWSAKLTNSVQRSYHNVTVPTSDSYKFTCYIYDGAGTRMWNDVRAYSGGVYNSGTLNQGLSIGKNN